GDAPHATAGFGTGAGRRACRNPPRPSPGPADGRGTTATSLPAPGKAHAMARIDAILKLVKEQGASDLHLTTGSPPMIRIQGEITPIPHEPLSREACELLLFELMDAGIRARYD